MVKEVKEPLDVENLKIGDTYMGLTLQKTDNGLRWVNLNPPSKEEQKEQEERHERLRKRTVGELKEWLKQFNDDERVWAYEGEACGICTEDDIFETRS